MLHLLCVRMEEDGEAFVPGPELRLPENMLSPPTSKLFSVILKVTTRDNFSIADPNINHADPDPRY